MAELSISGPPTISNFALISTPPCIAGSQDKMREMNAACTCPGMCGCTCLCPGPCSCPGVKGN